MKKICIDFAPASIRRTVLITSFKTWIFLFMGLALWTGIAFKGISLMQQKTILEAKLSQTLTQVQSHIDQAALRKQSERKFFVPEAQATAINNAIAQLNLPWRDLFDAIEAATPPAIALMTIEPDAKKHLIKGMAEAKSSNAMIAYIEQLKKEALFTHVVLTKHEVNEQDANMPIRFQFEAQWVAVSP